MSRHNKQLGTYGERLAAAFLKNKGCRILERNFKNKCGEIDIIAQDGKVVCFVEVKSRQSLTRGMPQESVHYFKQQKIIKVALSYLKFRYGTVDVLSRFDVIAIFRDTSGINQIEHITNAFEAY